MKKYQVFSSENIYLPPIVTKHRTKQAAFTFARLRSKEGWSGMIVSSQVVKGETRMQIEGQFDENTVAAV